MDDALLNEFINESREHLATIETDLLAIEEGGDDLDDDLINKVFRAAHSIKGGSAFFGLSKVKELAHKAETVLDMLRSGKMKPNAEITNVLLASFDKLREMVENPAEQEHADISELVVALSGMASSYLPQDEKVSLVQNVTLEPSGKTAAVVILPQVDFDRARRSNHFVYCVDIDLIHDIERKGKNVLAVFRDIWETGEILDCSFDYDAVGTLDGPLGNQLPLRLVFSTIIRADDIGMLIDVPKESIQVLFDPNKGEPMLPKPPKIALKNTEIIELPKALDTPIDPELPLPSLQTGAQKPRKIDSVPSAEHKSTAGAGEGTLRVNVGLLETLMNLAGELVLSRNQLRAAISNEDTRSLSMADQRINQVTSELQDAIMQTRLQPIGTVFNKFPRVVRDLAGILHKDIQLDIRGKDVALDKSMIEGLSDPLTHMVRNAVDHGIELPEVRIKNGKKPQGTIQLEARHEAGHVIIEIADDGGGINPQKLGKSAVTKGLISAEKLASLSEQEIFSLIFLPGFSTAEKVTDLSGRGVGMDVVKTNLDRLGGKVEIQSAVGNGTLFRIKLPLTLAIMPSLIISVGTERFAIPQVNVEELLHIRAEDVGKKIDVIGLSEVLLLRDRIIPLVRFSDILCHQTNLDQSKNEAMEIVVVTTGVFTYALSVGSFHDTEEIVVKPLGRHLKGLGEYAGATILGDGTVALILDVAGLGMKAGLSGSGTESTKYPTKTETAADRTGQVQSLLIFHNAPDEPCAAPLESVIRIERIRPEQVENIGGRRTMQYRGESLSLVTLSDVAQVGSIAESRDLAVIVASVKDREVGILGAMPVDVVESKSTVDTRTHRQKGIAGSSIINNQTVLLVNLTELVEVAFPEKRDFSADQSNSLQSETPVVVLAEDSDFFRLQVKKYIEEAGVSVLEAADGEKAWQVLLEHLDQVQLVVTDVEMPQLNGFELAKRIRADSRTSKLPVIGLTSLAGDEDIAHGKDAGFTDYQVKLDRDQLLMCLQSYITPAKNNND